MFLQNKENEAIGAPSYPREVRIQSIVILVVSVLSLCGAGFIMTSYRIFPNLRSFRHRLIIGLAISDFLMAFNFLCSTSMNLSGRFIGAPQQADFCSLNGFMAQVFVIQTDYWVLTIAICTYFILAGQRKRASWVQNHEVVIWGLPWFFSVLWASIGLGVVGYENIGAWCWFKSDKVRLLVNFVPRWIIIGMMFVLYAYLAIILYRAHNRLTSMQEFPGHLESGYSTREGSRATSIHEGLEDRSMVSIRRLKRIARLLLLYPLAYAIVWSIPTAIRIYQTTQDKPAAFALQNIDQACIVIQGLVDAVIYGLNETTVAS
ncbi:hypothetical protein CORC01_12882 [Colletotrichum orchidophilum]|uniref:G-protein coupled receptors family 2 profile 2 domain-containing protein n=1 Tax=Colletotrichum orchidophilum TaxID=1209926 RepID=A0A1G4ARL2_9PEZI|nr:uncharacterized protein CORC01_12882 [Colletotrichum orchidophilum]OHE91808.1 hypothetical protein CORC01_12882 [Colletotrichum orchidophilum]